MPIPGFVDDEPIGSIKPTAAAPVNPFEAADWRIAEPALRAAMRAQSSAPPSTWSNSDTGRHGQFLAVAGPFKRAGRDCRAFLASIEPKSEGSADEEAKVLQGVGCKRGAEEIVLEDVAPWKGL
jgi:hypothetical protein